MVTKAAESDTRELVEELSRLVSGEVRFDKMTRMLYSTDASLYQIEPIGVVLPKNAEDVIAVVETANRHGVPVLPRGGGTSLAGQTVGQAIVVDFSKYMRDIIEVNEEEGWVRAQPGIILDELNHEIRSTNMMFAPDPSTSNRGNIGGALGNNSCGAHSIVWGKTVDNVHDMDVVLSDGATANFGALNGAQLEAKLRADGLEGDIYRTIFAVGDANRDEILARYPKIQRRVSGYNLDEFVGGSEFNMARFVVGSEGTLVTITEAKLRLVPMPKFKALSVLHFDDLIESMEATVIALEIDPSAVELIGSMILRQAQSNLAYARMTDFIVGQPEALLVVELTGETESELNSKLDDLEGRMRRGGMGYAMPRLTSASDQANVWDVRKAGLGLMMNVPGDAKPLPFVEDTAVAPEKLPEFVKRFDEIVRAHGTEAGYYGHASVGCLHIRPLIDIKQSDGVDTMVSIAEEISDLVLEFGGSLSGEHGDGLVRSPFNEKMFGGQLYQAFREVKKAFDPDGIMNPGKITDAAPMTENLRLGPGYSTVPVKTGFHYSEEGSFAHAIEMCNGQGACRKVLGGTMCPSYMVTREEEHSTRGRANALRGAMSGALPAGSLTSKRLFDVMDLCLECKGCKAECPSNVDMTKLKYEFLDKYHKANGFPLRNRIFGNVAALSRLGSFFAPLTNWSMKTGVFKDLLEKYAGVDRRRTLPPLAGQSFTQWFRARGGSPAANARLGQVLLFPDTFTNYNHPELGRAATKVLEGMGFQVVLPKVTCCGRPMLSKGMMDKAKSAALTNVDSIYEHVKNGVKLVGIEPSCILSFKDDYPDLLADNERAKTVAENTMLIEEFVLYAQEELGAELKFTKPPKKVLLHGHCHQKALVGTAPAMQVLNSIPGCDAREIPSGCCGMAGSFGMEKEHYDMSMSIGEMTLFPAIRDAMRAGEGEFEMVAEGISCRQQIRDGTAKSAKHLVELLADAM
ncbi:MAG: FAD-binding protein [Chloroflexi bacterium]|nr:FAD-binding protein [Chloroflexota bacterium]MCI0813098.1 FAD-binding protein [Chloroflexota bacterium]